jgi:hypothetical protein
MASGPNCIHCKNLWKRFSEEDELRQILATQYVMVKLEDSDSLGVVQTLSKTEISGIPHLFIFSAQGEEIYNQAGAPQGDNVKKMLLEGIEKTGGIKTIKSEGSASPEAAVVVEQLKAIAERLDSDDTVIGAMLEMMALGREHIRSPRDVRKQIGAAFSKLNVDKSKAKLLAQARLIDAANQANDKGDLTKATKGYENVVRRFADSPGAKYAQAKLDYIEKAANGETPESSDSSDAAEPTASDSNQ